MSGDCYFGRGPDVTFVNRLPRGATSLHTARVTTLSAAEVLGIPHFARLTPAESERVAQELVRLSFQARELVAMEGEPCRGMFQLVSGRARLYRTASDGREQIMRLLHPGDTFGEVAVFDAGATPATVETLEACEVILLPGEAFRRIVDSHPAVALDLLHHFARRLRSFTELVEQVSLQTVQQRVARYLYFAAREEGSETPDGVLVPRSITLQDLASLVGSVREVVSRTLHVMETEGVVEVRRKEILVRDLAALRQLL